MKNELKIIFVNFVKTLIRHGKDLLEKHSETVAEIDNNERVYDDVRKEANHLNDSAKLKTGIRLRKNFTHI